MFRTIIFAACISVFCSLNLANAKQIALSFDDSPRPANGYLNGPQRAEKIITALKSAQVDQVAFFSVSKNLDEEGLARLKRYSEAGHIIANHTHSHPDFNKTPLEAYIGEIEKADAALRQFSTFRKWFRFPYLREGDTLEKRNGVRAYFQDNDYFNAYITLNNYDWYIEKLFQDALKQGKHVDFAALEQMYVSVLIEGINYYDNLALKHIDRSPSHVLLLHENDVAALFIGALIDKLKQEGWEIIPIETAFKDPISNFQIDRPLRFNPGRIGEIALTKGQKKSLWHHTLDEKYLEATFNKGVLGIKGK